MRTLPPSRVAALAVLVAAASAGAVEGQTKTTPRASDADESFRVYDAEGRPASLQAIVDRALASDVLLIGEEHDDSVAHVLELELLERIADASERPVVLSLEMFERDVQPVLDEYLAGFITEEHFLASARPWDHYRARYRPLVEAARERGLPVVAANAPRRYVNRVTREGRASLEALPEAAKRHLPPLPYPGPSARYRAEWDSVMAEAMGAVERSAPPSEEPVTTERPGHATSPNAIHAQALWDAAMGHAVATALITHLGAVVVHVAGSFHVARGTGIPERIADYRPGTRVVSVVMARDADVGQWDEREHTGLADYVILTRETGE